MRDSAKPGLFRGAALDLSKRARAFMFLFLLILAASLCYSQFGVVSLSIETPDDLNFVLLLIPVALCTVMLGVDHGIGLALITGVLVTNRAIWTTTNAYDAHLADPLLSVVSIVVGAAVLAAIATPIARKHPTDLAKGISPWKRIGAARIISLIIGSFALAAIFSYGSRGLIYLIIAPGGTEFGYASMVAEYLASVASPVVFLEVFTNTAILAFICIASVAFDAHRRSGSWKSGLSAAFTRWLALAMVMVFMVASSVSFCVETVNASDEAESQLLAELGYLQKQVGIQSREGGSAMSIIGITLGYRALYGGQVFIVHDQMIISSNIPRMVGEPASRALGSEYADNYEFLVDLASQRMLTNTDDTGALHGIRAIVDDDYTYIAVAPLETVYKARTAALVYNAFFMLIMLVVVFLVTRFLLLGIVVKPIHRTNETLGHITDGELTRRVNERAVNEFDELSTGINTTVSALRDTIAEVKRRTEQDVTAGKAIQESALPRDFPPFPSIDRFDIYASMKPARGVGGDFYDFFLVGDERLGFVLADVSGKGIPAALFMMAAKTQIRSYLSSGLPVDEAVNAANHQLCIGNEAGMFVTAWIGDLNYQTGELSFVNAGHNPPLLHHDGCWAWKRESSGMPVGLFDGIPYDKFTCQLEDGDTLYLYTDGVTEAMNVDGKLFGEERLAKTLENYSGMNARSVSLGVSRAVTEFALGAEQSDDLSMVTLRYGVPPEKRAMMILPALDTQLIHVNGFIREELRRRRAPKSVYNPLSVAAEELFVNVCRYAYPDATPDNPGQVRIEFEYAPNPPALTVRIIDDGIPYDPLAHPDAETPDNIDDVPIGGLGILIAKRSVDDMHYERIDGCNVLTFRKGW